MSPVMDRGLDTSPLVQPASHVGCYPTQPYVLATNCYKACIHKGKSTSYCQSWALRCRRCWSAFVSCRARVGHMPGYSCASCSNRYAYCIRPLLNAIGH